MEERSKQYDGGKYNLGYHISTPAWINDPNGLVEYKGEYHVFYQHHPYSESGGPMHWGHVKSKDLVHWERLPIALAPTEKYDKDGCFSGSAIVKDEVLILFYTGFVLEDAEKAISTQVQCMAVSEDGINFTKVDQNPIISKPPAEGSYHFRDPKVWEHNGSWYMVVGTTKEDVGKVVLYTSLDLIDWEYRGVLAKSDDIMGYMWECPDFFHLDGKDILLISPQGIKANGDQFNNLYQTGYISGSYNYEHNKYTRNQDFLELDKGHDFYAAQTFEDTQGRRIIIGWMDMWESKMPTKEEGWAGAHTLPRILTLGENDQVVMNPVPELDLLRNQQIEKLENKQITLESELVTFGQLVELEMTFNFLNTNAKVFGIKLRCSDDGEEDVVVGYNVESNNLFLDRKRAGMPQDSLRQSELTCPNGKLKLHIYLDRSSIEVFANDGLLVMTSRIYLSETSNKMKLFTDQGYVNITHLESWSLKDIWEEESGMG